MLSVVFAGLVRRARRVLSGAVVFMFGVVALALLLPTLGRYMLLLIISLPAAPLAVLAVVAWCQPRQAAFIVDLRTAAFCSPPHEGQLFFSIAAISFSTEAILLRLSFNPGPGGESPAFILSLESAGLWVTASALVALAAAHFAVAWRGVGVQLRPDAVVDRTPLGNLTIPWVALALDYPPPPPATARRLSLVFVRPELVRRRGLVFWSSIQVNNVDPVFLANAIRFYVVNPDRRPSIGTQTGYEELLRAIAGPRPALQA